MRGRVNKVVGVCISERVTSECRSERKEGANGENIWRKRVQWP